MLKRAMPCADWLSTQTLPVDSVVLSLTVCEPKPFIQVSHFRGPQQRELLESKLNVALPQSKRIVMRSPIGRIYWLAPESYGFYLEGGIAIDRFNALPSECAAVVDLSHARVRVCVRGERANELLRLGISVDLDPREFRPGDFIQTVLDHNPVLLEYCDVDHYELMFLRTFAETQLHWLVDAASAL